MQKRVVRYGMDEIKLTIRIDRATLERAKQYARQHVAVVRSEPAPVCAACDAQSPLEAESLVTVHCALTIFSLKARILGSVAAVSRMNSA